eukprot:6458715-Prymnesium_polylepis.1
MGQQAPRPPAAVQQPDGGVAVAEAVPPCADIVLSVTPSLKVPGQALPTMPLAQRIDELARGSGGFVTSFEAALMASLSGGGSAAGREAPTALVDEGGKLPHDPDEQ